MNRMAKMIRLTLFRNRDDLQIVISRDKTECPYIGFFPQDGHAR